jgi:hypothetical protein
MNTHLHKIAFALSTALVALTFTSAPATAETKLMLVGPGVDPGFVPQPYLPKFGFASFSINGVGERVTFVRWGGLASQFGLEPGDIILSMNGYPLTYHGSWNDALYNAMSNSGWVQLKIRDVRTGFIAQRQLFVGGGGGPIVHHYNSGGNINHFGTPDGPPTLKSTVPKNGNPSPKLSKKIAQVLNN